MFILLRGEQLISDSFRVRRSVGGVFVEQLVRSGILTWYVSASRTTLARPLSARRTMIKLSPFRLLRASCCSFVMLGLGGFACWRMTLTALLTVSAPVPHQVV